VLGNSTTKNYIGTRCKPNSLSDTFLATHLGEAKWCLLVASAGRDVWPHAGINVMGREAHGLSVVVRAREFRETNPFSNFIFKCGALCPGLGGFIGSPYIYLGGGAPGSHPALVFPASSTPAFYSVAKDFAERSKRSMYLVTLAFSFRHGREGERPRSP
jgi:hypothetical protein